MNNRIKVSASAFADISIGRTKTLYADAVITVTDETLDFIRSLVVDILDNLDQPLVEGDGLCLIDRCELPGKVDNDILTGIIPLMKEQDPELYEEDDDVIEYHYTIDVVDLLNDNFPELR